MCSRWCHFSLFSSVGDTDAMEGDSELSSASVTAVSLSAIDKHFMGAVNLGLAVQYLCHMLKLLSQFLKSIVGRRPSKKNVFLSLSTV